MRCVMPLRIILDNMKQKRHYYIELAQKIIDGTAIDPATCRELINIPDEDTLLMCAGADMLREDRFGKTIHLCVIHNGKSGRCSEDCCFCAQSAHARTGAPVYPLMTVEELAEPGKRLENTPVNRYSIVTSGRGLSSRETAVVAEALSRIDTTALDTCASPGIIGRENMEVLKAAGVTRFHHNLETAASHFPAVCTTHTYEERVRTLETARQAGLTLCCGGIFGLGESQDQIVELALAIKALNVDAVPVNFLTPVTGTPAESMHDLTPLKCLRIIAFLRYVLPDKEIIICGGREQNLKGLHPFIFYAGASGIMTGDYLTTSGRNLETDLSLLEMLGLKARSPHTDQP